MAKKRRVKKGAGNSASNAQGELDEKSKKFLYMVGTIFVLLILLFIGLELMK